MPKIQGGCSCGNVRYSGEAEPAFQGVCHCKSCQKANASSFATIVAVPATSLKFCGEIKQYDSKADSGKGQQYQFCPNCGSPVSSNADAFPGITMIRAGTLDDPSWVMPAMEIYCDSKMPWVELGGGLKKFAKMPS